jgi:hypothetical protein
MTRPITDRPAHAWRALEREQRLAALASLGLFVSMFLPWYSKTDTFVEHNTAKATQASLSAFQAFSFVEAAVLLVSAGVLAMLFARVEGRDFQLPGGDGAIVMIAGAWAAVLIFYRLLDKPGLQGNQRITATVGVEWGIFIALLLALGLLYAGGRMRAAERPQPPLSRPRGRPRERDPEEDLMSWRGVPEEEVSPRRPGSEEEVRPRRPGPEEQVRPQRPGSEEAVRPRRPSSEEEVTPRRPGPEEQVRTLSPAPRRPKGSAPVPADRRSARGRPRYPPAPSEQMSFEDPEAGSE